MVEPVSVRQTGVQRVAVDPLRTWSDVPLWADDDAEGGAGVAAPVEVRDVAAAMRAMRAAGASLREVGARFGVHASTVSRRLAAADAVAA